VLYLCLAYGSENDWKALTKEVQSALLANDEVIRKRGDFMSALQPSVTTVRALEGTPTLTFEPFASSGAPLAGFSIIEANSLDDVVRLVANTPCARANGAIEIRPLLEQT
jgi:hypothetical protein